MDPKVRSIAVEASSGAFATIYASPGSWGYVEIVEAPPDNYAGGAFTPVGLTYQLASENYANTYEAGPGVGLVIGDPIGKHRSVGQGPIPLPDQTTLGTPYVKIKSAGAAGKVLVREFAQV